MDHTRIVLHRDYQIAPVDPRIFGGFLEHIGRAIYQGVYEPQSIHADEHGFRKDVLECLRRLALTTVRYPGGNFASGYHWLNGVGPASTRPTLQDLASRSIETNQFGTDEFMQLARLMGWMPLITANLHGHTRGSAQLGRILQQSGRDALRRSARPKRFG